MKIKSFSAWIMIVIGCLLVIGCLSFNKAPVPVLSVDPSTGEVPLTVMFDGSKSYDPDGSISKFKLDFGDGSISYNQSAYHNYKNVGNYTVTFEVVDNKGKSSSSKTAIVVTKPTVSQLELVKIDGRLGANGGTVVYRADLSKVNTISIASIIIYDEGSETSGMSGEYTGADIDALRISSSFCDNAGCVASAPSTIPVSFSPNNIIFTPGHQVEPSDFAHYGTDTNGFNLNNSIATLEVFDGRHQVLSTQPNGFISIGRGGAIAFNLANPISPDGLYLYIGEVAGNENILVVVSSSSISADRLLPKPQKQKYHGTCEALLEYVGNVGVTDNKGVNHPGHTGWIDYQCRYTYEVPSYSSTRKTVKVTKYKCPCNNMLYNKLDDCIRNCKVTLGCFTGICEPIDFDEEQVCLSTASPIKMRFTVSTDISMLDWSPSGTISNQCEQERARWTRETLNHEARHVKDIKDIINSANERLKNGVDYPVEGCGTTEKEALKSLQKKIDERAKQELSVIYQEMGKKIKEFHDSPESQILMPRCDKCQEH